MSLMSVRKTADDGKISIFTEDGVKVHKKKMFSSNAKLNHFSLEYVTNTDVISFH